MQHQARKGATASRVHFGRSTLGRRVVLLTSGLAAASAGFMVLATGASAHDNSLTGVVSCIDTSTTATYSITWTVANDYNLPETATVTNATPGGVSSVTPTTLHIASTPDPSNPSFGTVIQTLPSTDTGTVDLYVHGEWSDGWAITDNGVTTLPQSCSPTTTTTTSTSTTSTTSTSTTSSTLPASTTTTAVTTTTLAAPATTTTTTAPTGTATSATTTTTTETTLPPATKASSGKRTVTKLSASKATKPAVVPAKAAVTG